MSFILIDAIPLFVDTDTEQTRACAALRAAGLPFAFVWTGGPDDPCARQTTTRFDADDSGDTDARGGAHRECSHVWGEAWTGSSGHVWEDCLVCHDRHEVSP